MPKTLHLLPELEGEEYNFINNLITEMNDEEAELFSRIYREKRKDPQNILLFSVIGLLIVPGLQRFVLNQIGMGILYLLTAGLCFIGSIIDLVNHKSLCLEYNKQVAHESKQMVMQNK